MTSVIDTREPPRAMHYCEWEKLSARSPRRQRFVSLRAMHAKIRSPLPTGRACVYCTVGCVDPLHEGARREYFFQYIYRTDERRCTAHNIQRTASLWHNIQRQVKLTLALDCLQFSQALVTFFLILEPLLRDCCPLVSIWLLSELEAAASDFSFLGAESDITEMKNLDQ